MDPAASTCEAKAQATCSKTTTCPSKGTSCPSKGEAKSDADSSPCCPAPSPPEMPAYLAPVPRDFAGYKLESTPLPCNVIPLREPLCTSAGSSPMNAEDDSSSSSSNPPPSSFHALAQKLKTNQLVVVRSDDPAQAGAHAVYYVDHKAVWQLDPPGAAVTAAAAAAAPGGSSSQAAFDAATQAASRGGSHIVYEFDTPETGDGMSFVGVDPCLLLLTRAGGRLTVFLVNPQAGSQLGADGADVPPLVVLFDGSPLSPAPLNPHHATISASLLSARRDMLFVVLYEFWQEHDDSALKDKEARGISFVHEEEALRSAGAVAPTDTMEGFATISSHTHALHKLTAVQFTIENVPALPRAKAASATPTTPTTPAAGSTATLTEGGGPRMELVHSFSSVQNYELPKEEIPAQVKIDSEWNAPLACWLQLPPAASHMPTPPPERSVGAASTSSPTPPDAPFLWFVASRVPFLNETESVVHEVARRRADKDLEEKHARMRDRADQAGTEALPLPGIGAGGAAAPSSNPVFTSDQIVSDTHNLKHYAVDNEDDDTDMAEAGVIGKYSLVSQVDVRLQLYDMMGNLLAARPLRQQQFLFAHTVAPVVGGRAGQGSSAVVAVKQHEELLLYGVTAAPQTSDSLALGATGSVQPRSYASRMGIAMKPLFSFAGLGYVQSGKTHKKFFVEDGTHQFVVLSEYTRLVYVYGRPTKDSPTAPQYLLQLTGDDEDEGQQIYGLQTAIVPAPTATGDAGASTVGGPVQGKPLLYILTRHACRQFQLPIVTLPA